MLFITKKGDFMQGIEVGIDEILNCREKRVAIQNDMIKKYNKPVISFTMNIPGPIKTNNEIKKTFDIGKNLILEKLKENNIKCVVVPRKKYSDNVISASTVRQIIKNGNLEDLKNLVPETTYNYFLSDEAKDVIDKIRSQDNVIHY